MNYSRQEDPMIHASSQSEEEILQLPEVQLAMVGGGVADVTFS